MSKEKLPAAVPDAFMLCVKTGLLQLGFKPGGASAWMKVVAGWGRPCTSPQRIASWAPSDKDTCSQVVSGLPWCESCTRSLSDVSYPGWVFIDWNFATYWCQQMLYKYSHCSPPPPLWFVPKQGSFQSKPDCVCQN